jgi:hypothetical protein
MGANRTSEGRGRDFRFWHQADIRVEGIRRVSLA